MHRANFRKKRRRVSGGCTNSGRTTEIIMFSAETKLAGVFGNPIGHSLSPLLHNEIYKREGIDAVFLAFENPDIVPLIAAMRALPIHLAAVTIPHKETVVPLLDELDDAAKTIGSVNTII